MLKVYKEAKKKKKKCFKCHDLSKLLTSHERNSIFSVRNFLKRLMNEYNGFLGKIVSPLPPFFKAFIY